jgi:hypothetical protein
MKNQSFLTLRHPVQGQIRFAVERDCVRVDIHWPFDVSTGEWIDVSNEFPLRRYRSGIARLAKVKKTTIRALEFGSLALTRESSRKILLNIIDSNRFLRTAFQFPVNVTPAELLPSDVHTTKTELPS